MSRVVDRLVGRGPSLPDRVAALRTVTEQGRGRLPSDLLDDAAAVVRRAGERLALSGDHTVVALAGATGSGKSSTFNAVAGVPLTTVGVRRPTTSTTTGVAWGADDPSTLWEWLEVPQRHLVRPGDPGWSDRLDGLVLLDLPDHDSTEVTHHLEVDRLVAMVDLMVWVLDPQKYADNAVHERYLRRLSTHADVVVVTLNHVDSLSADRRPDVLADLRRRLVEDGLPQVPVVATSAATGEGIEDLRSLVAARVRDKKAAAQRLRADVVGVGSALQVAHGSASPGAIKRPARAELVDAFADAAGVETVSSAVERAVVHRGGRHTGWPVTAWLSRLRPDPLKRLHLDLGEQGKQLTALGRASVPEPTRVQRARVDTAVRSAADAVVGGLAPAWATAVRRASTSRLEDLNDALDRAVVGTDLGVARTPLWWRFARLLQVVLALALVVGALWLLALFVLDYLQVPEPPAPVRYGLPLPTWLLVLGAGGGVALGIVGRFVNGLVARSRAARARRRLRESIGGVVDDLVVAPVDRELAAHHAVGDALAVVTAR
ncbi:ABC transporter [Nocardioides marmoribigeumensis]|uniref:GTP-binding protein EngB required for normal cell division n=1 Tax=Nocardioides marmoribigeumensis TaxID=433649 RepID=A0ABU2C0N9_9ACTN|nr:ABC transporter [Nocardioides marmoribigeumensis]MDR7364193.1 GTP-binding protein EngB required for normal cell division [Nocardioides marmoribigeumensis]